MACSRCNGPTDGGSWCGNCHEIICRELRERCSLPGGGQIPPQGVRWPPTCHAASRIVLDDVQTFSLATQVARRINAGCRARIEERIKNYRLKGNRGMRADPCYYDDADMWGSWPIIVRAWENRYDGG